MQTTSVLIQSLCVPCGNFCRYCLLSWDGSVSGAPWERSTALAERFLRELREEQPELAVSFAFGYSMEHPQLKEALRTLRRLGSPMADFLQCDGMKMRSVAECGEMMRMLRGEGIRELNFTVYGPEAYHDRFAGRKGDFALLLRMMQAAGEAGLPFMAGIPLTAENAAQIDALLAILRAAGCQKIRLFIPHEEGRGKVLAPVRLTRKEFGQLSENARSLLNPKVYQTESEWLHLPQPPEETERQILISLRTDNIEDYGKRSAVSVLREIEALDEAYYAAFPTFSELAAVYGDPDGGRFYSFRDLFAHYRSLYAGEHALHLYDVTDERLSGSRRSQQHG
ncbi:MAG: radical SAM protein [Lachnospiraceae bacterium]|nr:radical SAM protein [Lachnospiraceae bacterium]